MKISSRLSLVIALTIIQISVTIWAALEISTGASLHRLNVQQLKYQSVLSENLYAVKSGGQIDTAVLQQTMTNIRQQPIDCIAKIKPIGLLKMRIVGADSVIGICEKDVKDANRGLEVIAQFEAGTIDRNTLIGRLETASGAFLANSNDFEETIEKTVTSTVRTMIPLVILISIFNVLSIIYLSRTVTRSLSETTAMLNDTTPEAKFSGQIEGSSAGELRELSLAAQKRIGQVTVHRQVADSLEEQVRSRTASLVQANEELAQFSYRASHDLKAPLSSSKGLAQIIIQDIDAGDLAEAKHNASKITEQMEKLEILVVDILDLARADLLQTDITAVPVAEVISEIERRYAEQIERKNIDFIFEDSGETVLNTSRMRLVQMLENLISNSIKYCSPTEANRLTLVRTAQTNDSIKLTVEDNGIGIPLDQHEKVFDLFKRFHPTVANGSGLGLFIVKKHADKLGGKIEFTRLKQGTRFTITLPKNEHVTSGTASVASDPSTPFTSETVTL